MARPGALRKAKTMSKSYKDMTLYELKEEISRVNAILRNKPNPLTFRQNKKYLENLEKQYRIKSKGQKM